MDDRRFDRLTKAVASGASRRSLLKGLLGLGGAALVGGSVVTLEAVAARRPAPTPRPPRCPGKQIPSGGQCLCPSDVPHKCGPDCCTGASGDLPVPNHSECCDNACCFGTCYGEELCCPTNPGPGEQPPMAQYCPGIGDSPALCCQNDTHCCGAGTRENACVDFSTGACCSADDCGPLEEGACRWECTANSCISVFCVEGTMCCHGDCVSTSLFEFCPTDPNECCATGSETCCGSNGCCADDQCNLEADICCSAGETVCGSGIDACCGSTERCCGGDTCCTQDHCTTEGNCCAGDDIACTSDCCPVDRCVEGFGCCSVGTIACGGGCCPIPEYFCNSNQECECVAGTEACGQLSECCPQGHCTTEGNCCAGDDIACTSDCCPIDQCVEGFGCCPDDTIACGGGCCRISIEICNDQLQCACLPGTAYCGSACCPPGQCNTNNTNLGCCETGTTPCGMGCCSAGQCTTNGQCCETGTIACGQSCCNGTTQTCDIYSRTCTCNSGLIPCDGACIEAQCCGTDNSLCHGVGVDLKCTECVEGACQTMADFTPCGRSYCLGGECGNWLCTGTGACRNNIECCSKICEPSGQCQPYAPPP